MPRPILCLDSLTDRLLPTGLTYAALQTDISDIAGAFTGPEDVEIAQAGTLP